MKTIVRSFIAATAPLFAGTPALAAAGSRQDHSSMVVWAFLAFCALIVIAQLLPAIRSARQAAREKQQRQAETAPVRVTAGRQ